MDLLYMDPLFGGGFGRSFLSNGTSSDGVVGSAPNPMIDPAAKEYLTRVLDQCRQTRIRLYSNIWNTVATCLLVFVFGGILWALYCFKPTQAQLRDRRLKTQRLVLEKMGELREQELYTQPGGLTMLPVYQNKGY